jgi:myo-inositol-1(or 4)-monophosphatase
VTEYADLAGPVEVALRATRARVQEAFAEAPSPERFKEDGSVVTDLDHELEARLAETLLDLEPSWGLVGEESGEIRAGRPTWHLDPVDGTANFSRRLGVFASQVVLVDGTQPLFAAVYEPLADAFTWAARGAGTWHQGVRVRIPDREVRKALVFVDVARSGLFREHPDLIMRLRRGTYKTRALGSIAIHLRNVAVGAGDGYLGGRAHTTPLHDVAPGALLVREAGGLVTDGRGGDALAERRMLVVGAPRLHAWLCELLGSI